MELGIFAKTFAGAWSDVLKSVQQVGLDRVQFNFSCVGLPSMPDVVSEQTRNATKIELKQAQVSVEAVSGTFNMIHPNLDERYDGLRRLAVIAEQCSWLGTTLITLCTGSRHPTDMWKAHPENNRPAAWNDLRQTLDAALEIAEQYNVLLGVEPETANVINTVAKATQLLHEVRSPRLRIVFDPANLFEKESVSVIQYRIAEGVDRLGEYIMSAHAKDRDSQGRVVAPGRGVLPYPDYLLGLKQVGYQGNLILHGLKADDVPAAVQFLNAKLMG